MSAAAPTPQTLIDFRTDSYWVGPRNDSRQPVPNPRKVFAPAIEWDVGALTPAQQSHVQLICIWLIRRYVDAEAVSRALVIPDDAVYVEDLDILEALYEYKLGAFSSADDYFREYRGRDNPEVRACIRDADRVIPAAFQTEEIRDALREVGDTRLANESLNPESLWFAGLYLDYRHSGYLDPALFESVVAIPREIHGTISSLAMKFYIRSAGHAFQKAFSFHSCLKEPEKADFLRARLPCSMHLRCHVDIVNERMQTIYVIGVGPPKHFALWKRMLHTYAAMMNLLGPATNTCIVNLLEGYVVFNRKEVRQDMFRFLDNIAHHFDWRREHRHRMLQTLRKIRDLDSDKSD